jgi:hypothetical protein
VTIDKQIIDCPPGILLLDSGDVKIQLKAEEQ